MKGKHVDVQPICDFCKINLFKDTKTCTVFIICQHFHCWQKDSRPEMPRGGLHMFASNRNLSICTKVNSVVSSVCLVSVCQ